MDVSVQTLTGSRKKIRLTVNGSDRINAVKLQIQDSEGVASERQRLYLSGTQLDDGCYLAECGVQHGSTLVLVHNIVDHFDNNNPNQCTAASSSSSSIPDLVFDREGANPRLLSLHEQRRRSLHRLEKALKGDGELPKAAAVTGEATLKEVHAIELEKCHSNIGRLTSEIIELKSCKQKSDAKLDKCGRANEQLKGELVAVRKEQLLRVFARTEEQAKLDLVGHQNEQLKGELIAVRNEYVVRDRERDAELDALQEDRDKYKEERNVLREKLEDEKQKTLCRICLDRPRDSLIFPCSHLHYCFACLQLHQERQRTCPTCRASISSVLTCKVGMS